MPEDKLIPPWLKMRQQPQPIIVSQGMKKFIDEYWKNENRRLDQIQKNYINSGKTSTWEKVRMVDVDKQKLMGHARDIAEEIEATAGMIVAMAEEDTDGEYNTLKILEYRFELINDMAGELAELFSKVSDLKDFVKQDRATCGC